METFSGPLGSHRNYIHQVAIENYHDYKMLCGLNHENGKGKTPDKYKEFRYFLNTIESFNNILEYLYFEHEDEIRQSNLRNYKKAVWDKYPELEELANLANAYKHSVRESRGNKNPALPWAKDLQKPQLYIDAEVSYETGVQVSVDYQFPWPIEEHQQVLEKTLAFWMAYIQHDGCDLKNV